MPTRKLEHYVDEFVRPGEDHFAAHQYLWFEGLALLRLARKRGLDIPNVHYRYCPPLAQVPMTERYQGDWVASIGEAARD